MSDNSTASRTGTLRTDIEDDCIIGQPICRLLLNGYIHPRVNVCIRLSIAPNPRVQSVQDNI